MKQEKWITGILCVLLVFAAGVLYLSHSRNNTGSANGVFATETASVTNGKETGDAPSASIAADSRQGAAEEYAVYICGEVKHPGVYRFVQAARVCDVVEAAGGFTKNAAQASVNQARIIADGEQIEILSKKQWRKSQAQSSSPSENDNNTVQDSGKVNLNTATETELMTLSGVGQSKAKAIIDYRTQNGLFGSVEDIMQVPGIKEGVFNQIKDSVTV